MSDDRRAMYDGFNKENGAHSVEWFRITKEFLKLAFAGAHALTVAIGECYLSLRCLVILL
jgi:hypothetical protein